MSGLVSSSLIVVFSAVCILAAALYVTKTVENFVKGLSLILIKRVRIGDIVLINNIEGTIEKISLKMITIKDNEGNYHYIDNRVVKKIENKSRNYDFCPIKVVVSKDVDIVEVINNIKDSIKQALSQTNLENAILDELEIYSIDKIDNDNISIEGKIKTSPYAKELVRIEIEKQIKNLRGKNYFNANKLGATPSSH